MWTREIKERFNAGIHAVELFASTLEERDEFRFTVKHLTEDGEVRIFFFESGCPLRPVSARHVGQGVLSHGVESGHADPPEGILNEVSGGFGIVLVEVWQDIDEPAFERGLEFVLRWIGRGNCPC